MIDELILKKAKDGDSEAFYKLIEPIEEKLYKTAYIYVKNESDALDCLQDAIIKAIKNLDKLQSPQSFNSWITRILVNQCKDYIKKSSKTIPIDLLEFENELIDYNSFPIEKNIDLNTALEELKDNEKEIIKLKYLEDKPLNEIATITEKPIGTIKSTLNRSLKKLKLILGGA